MKLSGYQLQSFCLPLKSTLLISGCGIKERHGIILSLLSGRRTCGNGELAPIPGLHRESLNEATDQLRRFLGNLTWPLQLPDDPLDWLGTLRAHQLFPSVRHALEMAIFNSWAAGRSLSPARVFADEYSQEIEVNALLTPTELTKPAHVEALVAQGAQTFKVKVGRHHWQQEAADLVQLNAAIPRGVKLRLDANRAFDFDDALQFAAVIKGLPIEYIEEPLQDVRRLHEFSRRSGMPIALDESVDEFGLEKLQLIEGLAAVVVKPSVIGDSAAIWAFAKKHAGQIKVVVSCAFYSGLGLAFATHLAAALPNPVAAGLGTWQWLEKDLTRPPFTTPGWRVRPDEWLPHLQVIGHQVEEG